MPAIVVSAGSTSGPLVLQDGDSLTVLSGGIASGIVLSSGAAETVQAGGTDDAVTVANGGSFTVLAGGIAIATDNQSGVAVISSGGTEEGIQSGGSAVSITLLAGALLSMASGGTDLGIIVDSGAVLIVSNGVQAQFATINGGGSQIVSSGGLATGTAVNSGGSVTVLANGQSEFETLSGGDVFVASGGVESAAYISSGGSETVQSSGFADADTIDGGGLTVSAGGTEDDFYDDGGTVLVAGGLLSAGSGTLNIGVAGSGSLTVAGGGTVLAANTASAPDAVILVGNLGSETGNVMVSGSGSVIDAADPVWVGVAGVGSLTIENAGTVAMTATALPTIDGAFVIGDLAGGSGSVVVTGSGSELNGGIGRISIGFGGHGTLFVTQGGTVQASAAAYTPGVEAVRIGYSAGATGQVTIDGSGATLAADGAVLVGVNGGGTLVIGDRGALDAGGTNDNGEGLIVDAGSGTGDVLVTGGVLSVTDGMEINANGTLAATFGGSVAIGTGLRLASGASLSVDGTSKLEIGGNSSGVAGSIVVDAGHSLVGAGVIADPVVLNGLLQAQLGVLQATDGVTGTGAIAVASGATLEIGGVFDGALGGNAGAELSIGGSGVTLTTAPLSGGPNAATATLDQANVQTANSIAFATAPGILSLSGDAGGGRVFASTAASMSAETVQTWTTADTLDLTDMGFAAAQVSYGAGTLSVTDASHTAAIGFAGAPTSGNFGLLGNDGQGGPLIGRTG